MRIRSQAFYICCAIAVVTAQVTYDAPCPTQVATSNFNLSAYMGRWYELQRYEVDPSRKGDCVVLDLQLVPDDNSAVQVREEIKLLPDVTMQLVVNGTMRLNQSSSMPPVGHMFGHFAEKDSDYLILSTDYNHYALVWSCEDTADNKSQRK